MWFGPLGRLDDLWAHRVLLDLSSLRDREVIDDAYFQRACFTVVLVALRDDLPDPVPDDVVRSVAHWLDVDPREADAWASELRDSSEVGPPSAKDRAVARAEGGRAEDTGPPQGDGILHLIPQARIAGRKWDFHAFDKDSNRPCPHGHDVEDDGVVLDPYTGQAWRKDGSAVRCAKTKELEKLWKNKKFRAFAEKARAAMMENQPRRPDALPPMPAETKAPPQTESPKAGPRKKKAAR